MTFASAALKCAIDALSRFFFYTSLLARFHDAARCLFAIAICDKCSAIPIFFVIAMLHVVRSQTRKMIVS